MSDLKKRCSRCGKEKYRSDFYINNSKHDGLRDRCKECDKIQSKVERARRRDKAREYQNKWQQAHPDKHYAYTKKWRAKKVMMKGGE